MTIITSCISLRILNILSHVKTVFHRLKIHLSENINYPPLLPHTKGTILQTLLWFPFFPLSRDISVLVQRAFYFFKWYWPGFFPPSVRFFCVFLNFCLLFHHKSMLCVSVWGDFWARLCAYLTLVFICYHLTTPRKRLLIATDGSSWRSSQ